MSPVRPPPADLAFPDALKPWFRPEQLVGSGGFGFVWRCEQLKLARTVAVKLVHPHVAKEARFVETFNREARLMARVAHPAITPILDHGMVEGVAYIVMPYLPGPSLQMIMARGVLPWREAVRYAHQVAQGLAALHTAGVVHRDLKPSNVLLDEQGDARVSDFGQSKLVGTQTHSRPGSLIGTPGYIAPERLSEKQDLPQSDLYALGVMLWAMVAGRRPYESPPVPGVAGHIPQIQEMVAPTFQPLPPFPADAQHVPAELVALIRRLLSMKPQERGRDAAQVVAELERLQMDSSPIALVVPRRWWRGALLAAAAMLLLYLPWPTSRPPLPPPREPKALPKANVRLTPTLELGVAREFALRVARQTTLPLSSASATGRRNCPLVLTSSRQLTGVTLKLDPGIALVGVNGSPCVDTRVPGSLLRIGVNWLQLDGTATRQRCGSAVVGPPFVVSDFQPMPPCLQGAYRDRVVKESNLMLGLSTDGPLEAERIVKSVIPASKPLLRQILTKAIITHQRSTIARGFELNMLEHQIWTDADVLTGARETLDAANALLATEPDSWEAWHDMGWILSHMGHFHMSVLALCRGLKAWPDSHWDWWELAMTEALWTTDEGLTLAERREHRQQAMACLERVRRYAAENPKSSLATTLRAGGEVLSQSLHLQ
jgi:serine/threonine protein kinase